MTETYTDDAGSYYGYDLTTTYTYKYTLSFAKDTVSMKIDGTVTSLGVTVSDSNTITGTYEYKSGEVLELCHMAVFLPLSLQQLKKIHLLSKGLPVVQNQ